MPKILNLTRKEKQEIRAKERRRNYTPEWLKEKKIRKCKTGEHNFIWHYDRFEAAYLLEVDCLGIPVKCSKCELEGVEWYAYSNVKDLNGNLLD